jgi:glycerol uptake facilitator-like aquaporin
MTDTVSDLMEASLLRVFNERNAQRRARAIDTTYAPDVRWTDDLGTRVGREALEAKVRAYRREMSIGPRVAVEYAVEAAGTFVLVLTVGSAAAGSNPWAPLAIGALLRALVDAGGHLLDGHNLAVTLAVLVDHQIGLSDAVAYWLVQLGAGLLAAAVVARAVVDPAQLAATATMSLTGRSLMAALAADVAAFVAAQVSRKRAGV